jgi:hypothetical protein
MQTRLAALVSLATFLVASSAGAVTLDDVRRTLTSMQGASSLKVRIETNARRVDGKEKTQSNGFSVAEDDGQFLRMTHQKDQLRPRMERGERADSSVGPTEAVELMNYAPALLKALDGATLKKSTAASYEGTAVTLLEIVPKREIRNPRLEKFVRSFSDVLLLYVGPGGVPVAAERTQSVKASLLVIKFEAQSKEKHRFVRSSDRLIVARHTSEFATSGLGQNGSGHETSVVSIVQ